MYLKLTNGAKIQLGDPTDVIIKMLPGSCNFHLAVVEDGNEKLVLAYDTWELAHLRKHQLEYTIIVLGKNAKIDENTFSIVEDS